MTFWVFSKPSPVLRRFNWSCFTADEHDRRSVLVDTRRPRKKSSYSRKQLLCWKRFTSWELPLRLEDDWRLSRCLCGAVVGRCQERHVDGGKTTFYRVLKYAVRLVSQTESLQIPLSAFVVENMMEFVQAHASYRFVIRDEEHQKPRILIWLFKPRMSLAYSTPTSRAIPKNTSVFAAKILYKLLVPTPTDNFTDIKSLLNKYPGFPQAEFLSYPMSVCHRLAGLLNQSNSAYPQPMRTMTGLEVGWLQRL